jgi:hypothetical protein
VQVRPLVCVCWFACVCVSVCGRTACSHALQGFDLAASVARLQQSDLVTLQRTPRNATRLATGHLACRMQRHTTCTCRATVLRSARASRVNDYSAHCFKYSRTAPAVPTYSITVQLSWLTACATRTTPSRLGRASLLHSAAHTLVGPERTRVIAPCDGNGTGPPSCCIPQVMPLLSRKALERLRHDLESGQLEAQVIDPCRRPMLSWPHTRAHSHTPAHACVACARSVYVRNAFFRCDDGGRRSSRSAGVHIHRYRYRYTDISIPMYR